MTPAPTELVVLKSPAFGASGSAVLPYRADHLRRTGWTLVWDDRRARLAGRRARAIGRIESMVTPFLQTWHLRRAIKRAPATLAFFESEGHGLALARVLGLRRRGALAIMSCWLGELVEHSGRWRLAVYRRLYRRVDLVTVFSPNQVPIVTAALRLPAGRVHAIPFGIDTDELAARATTDGGYLLAVGRDRARDWPTLYAGVAGTGRPVIVLTRPSQLPAAERPSEIDARGYVDRPTYLDLLAGCAGVLIVTTDVAYPSGQTVLLEALTLGKPCIVTDTPAMHSFATGEVDLPCHWIPVGDADALRSAIAEVESAPRPSVPVERLDARSMWDALSTLLRDQLPEARSDRRPR